MTIRWAVSVACIALLSASCVSRSRFDESEQRYRSAQQQIASLQVERDAIEERLRALEKLHDRLEARSEVMEEMIDTLRNVSACIRRLQLEVEGQPRPLQ